MTFDLDIVHSTTADNGARLIEALRELDAGGPLDLLGSIGNGRRYDDLLPHTVKMDIGEGLTIAVLDLDTLIAVKEEVGSAKDLAALPVLRCTRDEKQRR